MIAPETTPSRLIAAKKAKLFHGWPVCQ